MEKQLTCIVCPQGCTIRVTLEEGGVREVNGNRCVRGRTYAEEEIFHPTRTLTTTVRVRNGLYPLVPVKSVKPLPKEKIFRAMEEVRKLVVNAPIEGGALLTDDLGGTGVGLVTTRSVDRGRELSSETRAL